MILHIKCLLCLRREQAVTLTTTIDTSTITALNVPYVPLAVRQRRIRIIWTKASRPDGERLRIKNPALYDEALEHRTNQM